MGSLFAASLSNVSPTGSFLYERFCARTGFKTPAHCNSEMMRIRTENVWKRHVRTIIFEVFLLLH